MASGCGVSFILFCSLPAQAQSLSPQQQKDFITNTRAHYYSPRDLGLASFTCNAAFNFDTLPKTFLLPAEIGGRAPLVETQLQLTVNPQGRATINTAISPNASSLLLPLYKRFFGLMGNFVSGFAQTWAAKGLAGPVPDAEDILSVTSQPPMQSIHLPAGIQVLVDPAFLVNAIDTNNQGETIHEHPLFTQSPQGLLFTADDADMKQGDQSTHVNYTVDYQPVDGLQLPQNVHMVVNNITVDFRLTRCTVQKGITLHVTSPPR